MIRTKAKSLFLSIILMMACCVFFACKEKTTVKVESIAFTEQSISLLVGEEYTPDVKVLPSYATNRSYTLISSDSTALKIEGGTIEALKASLDVKLKVVSDENQNINDVISVNIYDEATDLSVPTELKFDGTEFTFVGKDNVESYVLKINGQEINIGNNTEYSFDSVASKINDLYDKVVTCSVKAVGDGKIFKDSEFGEEISFVKLSNVKDMYVENETLYFNAIENVASYSLDILSKGQVVDTKVIDNPTFAKGKLSFDLSEFSDSNNGAEYELRVTPKVGGFNVVEPVTIFPGVYSAVNYAVLGSVKNVGINDSIISWDFVKNAQDYTVEVYSDNVLLDTYENITTNYLKVEYDETGKYYCKVLANSQNKNTTTGKIYSDNLDFEVLSIPEIVSNNNSVSWNSIENAEGYLVTIKNNLGNVIVSKDFVVGNNYDVSVFGAGIYYIEVVACGNGQQFLSSKSSEATRWTTLYNLEMIVENEVLRWRDLDANSLHKYRLKFDTVDIVLTSADYDDQYKCDANETEFSYDLSSYKFTPGTYSVTVQNIGETDVFDSTLTSIDITKLPEASNPTLTAKVFEVAQIADASKYQIEIYKASDLNASIRTLNADGNRFALDDSDLGAGNYVAKVFVFGNGKNVFDADNENNGQIAFEKLATPTIFVDKDNLKLVVDKDGEVANADNYKIYEYSVVKNKTNTIAGKGYQLNLSAGDYKYGAQAIGNGTTVLDSAITIDESRTIVKKLALPTMSFDKNELLFTIACNEDDNDYVKDYTFTLNETIVPVAKYTVGESIINIADCKDLIKDAGIYSARLVANTYDSNAGYNLVIGSDIQTEIVGGFESVTKLSGLCSFTISNGKLIVKSNQTLSGSGYSLSFRIDGAEDIVLNDFTYSSGTSQFELALHDSKYNVIEALNNIMSTAGEYEVYTTISQNKDNVVTSDEEKIVDAETNPIKLKVLGKVSSISRTTPEVEDGQAIQFDSVADATNYIAVILIDEKEYYIDTKSNNNLLTIATLLDLMNKARIGYLENAEYSISFVSTTSDNHTLPNKGDASFVFEFLKSPELSIIEQADSNVKYLAIANDDINSVNYSLVVDQGAVVIIMEPAKDNGEYSLINMDDMGELEAGEVSISVIAQRDNGKYFNSKNSELKVIKLRSSAITVENGLLRWDVIGNAKQYNLTYSNSLKSETLTLTEQDFSVQGGKCVYEFDSLDSALTKMYLQVDSQVKVGNTYYLNSNDGETLVDIYKLKTVPISVVNGKIYTEITDFDRDRAGRIEIIINGVEKQIDITAGSDKVVIQPEVDKLCITIDPSILFTYGETELLSETLSIKLYSNNNTTLNSSIALKEVYGLLNPTGLDITTSSKKVGESDVIDEVFEKITWSNPEANLEYVSKYEIIVNYNELDHKFYSNTTEFMMPTFDDTDSDGTLDEGEVEFGAGVYTIKVRALTDNNNNIVNSKYCSEITVTVLATPTNLSAQDGNIIWSSDGAVEYYLVRVYLLKDEAGEDKGLIMSTQSHESKIDLTAVTEFETGVYGISVQAMHDNSKVLSSKESDIFEVVRLPQVSEYYIKNGEFYFKAHCFYTRAEITLTKGATKHVFPIENNDLTNYTNYISSPFTSWSNSNVIKTYTDDSFYMPVKYQLEGDSTLRKAGVEDYSVSIKLFGNTATNGAIISGKENFNPKNTYFENKTNLIEKLVTPSVEISEDVRGQVLVSVPASLNYSLKYYINGENALQGVHLYEVNISINETYTLYVAQIVNNDLFTASLTAVESELVQDGATRNNLKHFEYNDITFNVIDTVNGRIPFNFNVTSYAYYEPKNVETGKAGGYVVRELKDGGSFIVSMRFMGDDSIFVNSNLSNTVKVDRYDTLNLVVSKGQLSWDNLASEQDNPIYIITLTNASKTYNLVLYNPNVYTKKEVEQCLETGKEYIFDTITYQATEEVKDEVITYNNLANIMEGKGSDFNASVKAHYTNSSPMNVVLAQDAGSKNLTIIPKTQIQVVNGELQWNLVTISGSDSIRKYQLQVFDGTTELYKVELGSGDYDTNGTLATYQLPTALNNGEDSGFTFTPNSNYIFKLTALGVDSNTYVDSVQSTTSSVNLLPYLQDVRMENGVITWTNTTTRDVEICIEYTSGDSTVTITKIQTGSTFELPSADTADNGTYRYLVSGQDYKIKVRLKGGDTTLNGFFSEVVKTEGVLPQRLKTVNKDSIVTDNGLLTWEANTDFKDVKYTVVYTLEDGTTYTSNMLGTNSFDFAGVVSGVIKVKVYAHHNNHFTSFASNTDENGNTLTEEDSENELLVKLYKLGISDKIEYFAGSTTISWNKVSDGADGYINDYIVSIQEDGAEAVEHEVDTNEWIITGVSSSVFKIAVKAVSVDERGTLINGEYTEYQTVTVPNSVDVATFEYDEQLQAFKWKAIEGEQSGDKYYIGYNYYNTILSSEDTADTFVVERELVTTYRETDDGKYYYFYPYEIGSYRDIYVQVERLGSLSSQPTYCMEEDGLYKLNFDLFASGDGKSSDTAYIINSADHLLNIRYFLSAYYKIENDIRINDATQQFNGYITDDSQVFKGTINGGGNYIYGVGANEDTLFSSSGYVGLFNRVEGATFNNIKLTQFNLKGHLNSTTLYMGVLVGHANKNTAFDGIEVTDSTIKLVHGKKNTNNSVSMYVGVIAGYADSCNFANCVVSLGDSDANIIVEITGNAQTSLYIGGIAGYVNNCKLTNNNSANAFVVSANLERGASSTELPKMYVGALIGFADSGITITNSVYSYKEKASNATKNNPIGYEN